VEVLDASVNEEVLVLEVSVLIGSSALDDVKP